jgi:hypothetical protein
MALSFSIRVTPWQFKKHAVNFSYSISTRGDDSVEDFFTINSFAQPSSRTEILQALSTQCAIVNTRRRVDGTLCIVIRRFHGFL